MEEQRLVSEWGEFRVFLRSHLARFGFGFQGLGLGWSGLDLVEVMA